MALLRCFTPSRKHFASNSEAKAMRSGANFAATTWSSIFAIQLLLLPILLYFMQAGDLKRLLELYIGWQQRILPFSNFDVFLEALEKLGSSYVLKVPHICMQHAICLLLPLAKQGKQASHTQRQRKLTRGLSDSQLLVSADGVTRTTVRYLESPRRAKAGKSHYFHHHHLDCLQ